MRQRIFAFNLFMNPLYRISILLVLLVIMAGCYVQLQKNSNLNTLATRTSFPTPDNTLINFLTPTATIMRTVTKTSSPTIIPTQIPTPTLFAIGELYPIPEGYVYLGDPLTGALGFNFDAGGAIGSLLYQGIEMVDDADYGRYIQFSPYDGDDEYVCIPTSCFEKWGWNPLQAGSVDGLGAEVIEYRQWENGIYIKSPGVEWGAGLGVSDVIYETWAWDREGYFEIITHLTHIGGDNHTLSSAEFPAAYFGTSIPFQFGYSGMNPFTGQEIQKYNYFTDDLINNTNPQINPSENWLAYGNDEGIGLIMAVPNQKNYSPNWSMIFIRNAYPAPIGYMTPSAVFETNSNDIIELHYYLIPGSIIDGRKIVYDIIPHSTWTFILDTTEGWSHTKNNLRIDSGMIEVFLSPTEYLTSMSGLNFYGKQAPKVELSSALNLSEGAVCLSFITEKDIYWDTKKSSCQIIKGKVVTKYVYDFSENKYWNDGLINQVRINALTPVSLIIDQIIVQKTFQGWEFSNHSELEGWIPWNQLKQLMVYDDKLISRSTGDDPYLISSLIGVDAKEYNKIEVRMKVEAGSLAQIFFTTDEDSQWNETKSRQFLINGDGKFHIYQISMVNLPDWKGFIRQIRFDPMEVSGSFEIDYFRFQK